MANSNIEEVKSELQVHLNEAISQKARNYRIGAGDAANVSTGSKLAAMVKFGYKDYLMLMMFIKVCVDDEAVLGRTADIIQLNIQNATGESDQAGQTLFVHKQGSDFRMAEAKTYVTVQGSVKLDMLFLDMDFFNRLLVEEGTDIEEQVKDPNSNPDYLIDGKPFDCYTPKKDAALDTICSTIKKKNKEQTDRIVLNLQNVPSDRIDSIKEYILERTGETRDLKK